MKMEMLKSLITAFTSDGDYLAILSPSGTIKIWSTRDESLLAEWKDPDGKTDVGYSCMACYLVGKKRQKKHGFVIALGTNKGDVLVVNALSGETKWVSASCHPGGVIGLSFANKGHKLHAVGSNGMTFEMDSETGNIIREFRASKKSISSSAFSLDKKYLAVAGKKLRVLSMDSGDKLVVHPDKLGPVEFVSISDDAKTIVTSEFGAKHLQVWWCDMRAGKLSKGPVLFMKHPPFVSECKNISNEEGSVVVLSVSVSGVAYVWKIKVNSEEEVSPTKINVKADKVQSVVENNGSAKKNRISVIASRLHGFGANEVSVLVTHGSIDLPQHSLLNISNFGKEVIRNTAYETETLQQNDDCSGKGPHESEMEPANTMSKSKKTKKKRAASELDSPTTQNTCDNGNGDASDVDLNEPTMGERLASLNLLDENKDESHEEGPSVPAMPPSADSVHVLLKQALHADDRALLLECLYTKDDKVISKSIAELNSSNVLKLLHSLISIIQSRGAILVCALPWLRGLLLQHASRIMSQESSLLALNSLYQLIESRVSTFQSALVLSSSLDFLYSGVLDEEVDENDDAIVPIIFEDEDSEDDESGDEMETDGDEEEEEAFEDLSAGEVDDDDMSE